MTPLSQADLSELSRLASAAVASSLPRSLDGGLLFLSARVDGGGAEYGMEKGRPVADRMGIPAIPLRDVVPLGRLDTGWIPPPTIAQAGAPAVAATVGGAFATSLKEFAFRFMPGVGRKLKLGWPEVVECVDFRACFRPGEPVPYPGSIRFRMVFAAEPAA